MFIELCLTVLIGVVTYWYYCYFKVYWKLKNIPTPKLWPVIGNALELQDPQRCLFKFPKLLRQLNTKTMRFHMGFNIVLVSDDYKLIELVLGSPNLTRKEYYCMTAWLGQGLFTASGSKWRKTRKIVTPTFHFKILEQYLDVFNSNGFILVNKLRKIIYQRSVDIFPLIVLCTLDIICETAMGISLNVQLDENAEYARSVNRETNVVMTRALTPLLEYDWIYNLTGLAREERALLKILHGRTDSVIKMRRQKLIKDNKQGGEGNPKFQENNFGQKQKVQFLDMLLQSTIDGRPLTDKELRDEVSTFMFAGQDTTATGFSFALYCIANHPSVQEKLYKEIFSIFGSDKHRPCTAPDINKMKYMEMVIKEALRLYPPGPIIGRTLTEDVEYEGTIIPSETEIWFVPYSVHHNSDFFPELERFNPERFSAENCTTIKPYSFLPFSAGPRNCIGQKFAMMELKCVISWILRHYELLPATPNEELELRWCTVLKSLNGINLALVERN